MTGSHIAIIGLGSNHPLKASEQVDGLMSLLRNIGDILASSGIYSTLPYGHNKAVSFPYKNAVVALRTLYSLQELQAAMKDIELRCGRNRAGNNGIVDADADIVIWDGVVVREKDFERDYFSIGYNRIASYVENGIKEGTGVVG